MDKQSSTLLFVQAVILLGSLVCSGLLIRKAVNFHRRFVIGAIVFLVCAILFTYLGVVGPLTFMSDSTNIQTNLTIDIMVYSATGLIIIGIVCFVLDHIFEIPICLMVAAAAAASVGLAPFFYLVRQDDFNRDFNINIVAPEPPPETLPNPESEGWFS